VDVARTGHHRPAPLTVITPPFSYRSPLALSGVPSTLCPLNDAASIAASEVSDADNVTRVPSQASDTILRDTMQIQPVLRINQGAEVGIMVARDFDFSNIYGLRLRRGQ